MDHAVAVGFGHILQKLQGVTESGLGGPDVAAEVFGGGHDAVQRARTLASDVLARSRAERP